MLSDWMLLGDLMARTRVEAAWQKSMLWHELEAGCRRGAKELSNLLDKLVEAADRLAKFGDEHMTREEVLPWLVLPVGDQLPGSSWRTAFSRLEKKTHDASGAEAGPLIIHPLNFDAAEDAHGWHIHNAQHIPSEALAELGQCCDSEAGTGGGAAGPGGVHVRGGAEGGGVAHSAGHAPAPAGAHAALGGRYHTYLPACLVRDDVFLGAGETLSEQLQRQQLQQSGV